MTTCQITNSQDTLEKRSTLTMPKYPGLGLPLRHGMHRGNIQPDERKSYYPIGAHHSCGCSLSDPLPIREVAMMSFMDTLTDKEEWHKKVFDEEIVAKWHEEARQIPDQHFRDMVGDGDKLGEHVNMSGNPAKILDDNAFEYVSYVDEPRRIV